MLKWTLEMELDYNKTITFQRQFEPFQACNNKPNLINGELNVNEINKRMLTYSRNYKIVEII